jgi:type II secretory pathway component PulC
MRQVAIRWRLPTVGAARVRGVPGGALRGSHDRLIEHLPRAVAVLACLAIVGQVAAVTIRYVRQTTSTPRTTVGPRPVGSVTFSRSVYTLFGAPRSPDQVVESAAPLVLTGVIADADPTQGYGIIGETREKTALYGVGAALPGGARLAAVFADRVELDRNGQREVVRLPRREFGISAGVVTLADADAEEPAARSPKRRPNYHVPEMPDPQVKKTKGQIWAEQHLAADWTSGDGRIAGIELLGAAAKSPNGLHRGDVLVAVNGKSATDRERVLEILASDDGSSPPKLTVLRNGSIVELEGSPGL